MENAKINKLMEERKTIDEITFKKAGIGPLKKTFKHDPTRVENWTAPVAGHAKDLAVWMMMMMMMMDDLSFWFLWLESYLFV